MKRMLHAALRGNRAANGGAIAIAEGAPRIERMVFDSNVAQLSGGAISLQASAENATAIQVLMPVWPNVY